MKASKRIALILLLLPSFLCADTIVLKDGRTFVVDGAWEENEQVKGRLKGAIVGFPKGDVQAVQTSPQDRPPVGPVFKFDLWRSGLAVKEAIDIAERNDIPLVRDGLVTISKGFKPEFIRDYDAQSVRKFYYKTSLLGRGGKVEMEFTPTSKYLFMLKVHWGGPGASKSSPFFKEVQSMLSKKYGKPFKNATEIFFYREFYEINSNAYAELTGSTGSVKIQYFDKRLQSVAEQESAAIQKTKQTEYMNRDFKKF